MSKPYILGLDLGGTKINTGLVNHKGKIILSQKIQLPTRTRTPKSILKILQETIQIFFSPRVKAIGLGIPGVVDWKQGILKTGGPNLKKLKNLPLKKILTQKFKTPVSLDNDANCFTLAESILGQAKKYQYVLGITLGTGIGGGIVIDKKIYHGRDNAIEIGHIVISDQNTKCGCGQRGDFESLCSGTAMVNLYKKITGKTKDTFQIEKEAIGGRKTASQVLKTMRKYLSLALVSLIHTLNPDIIVIGGGLTRVNLLIRPTLQSTPNKLIYKPILQTTKIVKSRLGDKAGILGAALITNKIKF